MTTAAAPATRVGTFAPIVSSHCPGPAWKRTQSTTDHAATIAALRAVTTEPAATVPANLRLVIAGRSGVRFSFPRETEAAAAAAMVPAIALSAPQLGDYNGEPVLYCLFDILPTGSMFEADQIMRGRIFRPAVLRDGDVPEMVAAADPRSEVMAADGTDCDLLQQHAVALNESFISYLVRLQLWEGLTCAPGE